MIGRDRRLGGLGSPACGAFPRWFARGGHRRRRDPAVRAVLVPVFLEPRSGSVVASVLLARERARRARPRCRSPAWPRARRSAPPGPVPGAARARHILRRRARTPAARLRPRPVPQRVLDALAQPTIGHLDPRSARSWTRSPSCCARRSAPRTASRSRSARPAAADADDGRQPRRARRPRGLRRARRCSASAWPTRSAAPAPRSCAWRRSGAARSDRARSSRRSASGTRALFVVHGETSTGVAQPLDGLAEACARSDALLLVDCVTSLAGHPLDLDDAGVDAAFSGTQKCLNCPPGPGAVHGRRARAASALQRRRRGTSTCEAVLGYWTAAGGGRAYHHTAPINMVFALREALRDRAGGGPRGALGAPRQGARGAARRARASSASSASRPTASSCTRCWPCACPRASTRPRSAARCCASTASRSPAASGRSPARRGGSA